MASLRQFNIIWSYCYRVQFIELISVINVIGNIIVIINL